MKNTKLISYLLVFLMLIQIFNVNIIKTEDDLDTLKYLLSEEELEKRPDDNEVIPIFDYNLNRGFHEVLGYSDLEKPLTKRDLRRILNLSPEVCQAHTPSEAGVKVIDLTGIELAENLVKLSMVNQRITDLMPISELVNLRYIELRNNTNNGKTITDLTPLTNLVNVEFLNLQQARFIDGSPLSNLTKMKNLNILGARINNIDFIRNMKDLERLDASYTEITSTEPFNGLKKLRHLNLSGNPDINSVRIKINDISVFNTLQSLEELLISSQAITDIEPLKNLNNLRMLNVSNNQITNFEPLLFMDNLSEIFLNNNPKELNNDIANLFKAREFAKILSKEKFDKSDLTKLNELKNDNGNIKNYFSDETLIKLDEVIEKIAAENEVSNSYFTQFFDEFRKSDDEIVEVLPLEDIDIIEGEELELPTTVKVKIKKKENSVKLGISKIGAEDVVTFLLVDENNKPIKSEVSFNNKKHVSENGIITVKASQIGLQWDYYKLRLDEGDYIYNVDFHEFPVNLMKYTPQAIDQVNNKDVKTMNEDDFKIHLKNKNATESKIEEEESNEVVEVNVVWDKGAFKNEIGNYTLIGNVNSIYQNPNNLKAQIIVNVLENKDLTSEIESAEKLIADAENVLVKLEDKKMGEDVEKLIAELKEMITQKDLEKIRNKKKELNEKLDELKNKISENKEDEDNKDDEYTPPYIPEDTIEDRPIEWNNDQQIIKPQEPRKENKPADKKEDKKEETAPEPTPEEIITVPEKMINITFKDIEKVENKEEIQDLAARGILKGDDLGNFNPEEKITRAMLVETLYRISKDKTKDFSKNYVDVNVGDWYYESMKWAIGQGIIQGNDNQEAMPNKELTREELAVIIARFIKDIPFEIKKAFTYTDENQISDWAKAAIKEMDKKGIITGSDSTHYSPKEGVTRKELAHTLYVIIQRVLELSK